MNVTANTNVRPNWFVQIIREVRDVVRDLFLAFIAWIIVPLKRILGSLAELGVYFLVYVLWVLAWGLFLWAAGKFAGWFLNLGFMVQVGNFVNSDGGTVTVSVVILVVAIVAIRNLRKWQNSLRAIPFVEASAFCSGLWILAARFNAGILPLIKDHEAQFAFLVISMAVSLILFGISYWYKTPTVSAQTNP